MNRFILLAGFCLSACVTASPLAPEDQVSIEGRLEQADGNPASDIPLRLSIPGGALTDRSNAAGNYRFSLTGSQTQVLGIAAGLELQSVPATPGDSRVRQSVKVLKTSLTLPAMRFWDGLQSPAPDAEVTGSRTRFSWQAPVTAPRLYRFSLLDSQGDAVWKAENTSPELELPVSVMAPQQSYRWQVSSVFSDYEAFSRQRPLKSGTPSLTALPVRSIRTAEKAYPSFHDGRYSPDLAERLDYPQTGSLELEIELTGPASIQGLHWAGNGFSAQAEIRTQPGSAPILTHNLKDYALLEWPAVNSNKLYITLTDPSGGFADIAEIRVLGSS